MIKQFTTNSIKKDIGKLMGVGMFAFIAFAVKYYHLFSFILYFGVILFFNWLFKIPHTFCVEPLAVVTYEYKYKSLYEHYETFESFKEYLNLKTLDCIPTKFHDGPSLAFLRTFLYTLHWSYIKILIHHLPEDDFDFKIASLLEAIRLEFKSRFPFVWYENLLIDLSILNIILKNKNQNAGVVLKKINVYILKTQTPPKDFRIPLFVESEQANSDELKISFSNEEVDTFLKDNNKIENIKDKILSLYEFILLNVDKNPKIQMAIMSIVDVECSKTQDPDISQEKFPEVPDDILTNQKSFNKFSNEMYQRFLEMNSSDDVSRELRIQRIKNHALNNKLFQPSFMTNKNYHDTDES